MKILLNLIWMLCGGFLTAMEYFASSVVLMLTIVGIPFALQTFKLGVMTLMPFGQKVVRNEENTGCLSAVMNVVWFFIGGVWIWLTNIFFGVLLCITIVGIPFGRQHFKLSSLALTPFGRDIVPE